MINDGKDCNETAWGVQSNAQGCIKFYHVDFRVDNETISEIHDSTCVGDCISASHRSQRVVPTSKLVSRREGNVII